MKSNLRNEIKSYIVRSGCSIFRCRRIAGVSQNIGCPG